MSKVLIVGAGVVGTNMKTLLEKAHTVIMHDPAKGLDAEKDFTWGYFDYTIICVPTDMDKDGRCDTSIVERAVNQWKDRSLVTIIKSTVPPKTTKRIRSNSPYPVVFSPEYYGGTQHANTPHPFEIIGEVFPGEGAKAMRVFQDAMTGYTKFFVVSSETAELVKYAENTWLAMQVTFFSQMYQIEKKLGIDPIMFREALLLDERISRSHSIAYGPSPHYDSHCLNKDLPALLSFCMDNGIEGKFIAAIISSNEAFKKL